MHFPDHFRNAFLDLVERIEETGAVPETVAFGGAESTGHFLRRFAGCGDIIPAPARDAVTEMFWQAFGHDCQPAAVGTYARAARRIDEIRRGQTALVL